MARFSEHPSESVYLLAERWRDECLIEDHSLLFPAEALWTPDVIGELVRRYNENLLLDDRTFEEKFREQLGSDRRDITRLAADVLVVYFLFAVDAVNGPRKRELISAVLSWGGDSFDADGEVAHVLDGGIGNPGQGYNNLRWAHIAYFVAFARRFKELDSERCRELLADPWVFKAWLVEGDEGEQMGRHLLLHLLFPDSYERIASTTHKYRIRDAYEALVPDLDHDVDRALFQIRDRIHELMPDGQPRIPGHIDFYWPPLKEGWNPEDPGDDPDSALTHLSALEMKRQVVLYGPPGTGKTFEAKDLAARLLRHQALVRWGPVAFLENADVIDTAIRTQVRRLQLHQAWSYEQFLGGLKLTEQGTELEEGYLSELVREVKESRDGHQGELAPLPWVLILDELNRTDLSRLLGEAFSMLDDRGVPIDLAGLGNEQERRTLTLPEDLFLIGTLNLIDQSVEQLDFALRRRFLWLYSGFQAEAIPRVLEQKWSEQAVHQHHPFDRLRVDVEMLKDRATELNREIASSRLLGGQYEIGHTYFFEVGGYIAGWPRVRPKGQRPSRYLWRNDGTPLPPTNDLWRCSLKPLLEEYLAGIEPDVRDQEVARLRDVFLHGK